MEKYLYFVDTSGNAAPSGNQQMAMYPTSSVLAIFAASATETRINLLPRDGAGTAEDLVKITHADGDHKAVMSALVAMINSEKNNNPFVVVGDKENGIFNIAGVTDVDITSNDN
tara:strand:+ start:393 stop:734 length:342 start_codon:yes stop_codon:yes gene_type:complete